jgi:hypothetical protein
MNSNGDKVEGKIMVDLASGNSGLNISYLS